MTFDDLHQLFIQDIPLLDVRAPCEFDKGAFPLASNHPILNDMERETVGRCYKQKGQQDATALGHKLVSGSIKSNRVNAWQQFLQNNKGAQLYCFRGGQRSQIAQQWLQAEGVPVQRVEGGYKRMRSYLLSIFDNLPPLLILSGKTGVGKTELLQQINATVDLEASANHRGSAFGRRLSPQPAQINFENAVAIDFIKLGTANKVIIEDEGHLIGRVSLPVPLRSAMKQAPILLLEDSLNNRVDRIFDEYVIQGLAELISQSTPNPLAELQQKYTTALSAIKKRLGGAAFQCISGQLENAFVQHQKGQTGLHKIWIASLLVDYYDPMYEYQLERKKHRLIETGDQQFLKQYLHS
ncbi:MAG: tRNA 2-selenouridine(34) synthase MnmH [Pseudomonadales bacterium]|nr:tRNA 2-selenouridine(34) synthase MnmH [Pseudomonadales bacterium]